MNVPYFKCAILERWSWEFCQLATEDAPVNTLTSSLYYIRYVLDCWLSSFIKKVYNGICLSWFKIYSMFVLPIAHPCYCTNYKLITPFRAATTKYGKTFELGKWNHWVVFNGRIGSFFSVSSTSGIEILQHSIREIMFDQDITRDHFLLPAG